jgi:hypothetical protein
MLPAPTVGRGSGPARVPGTPSDPASTADVPESSRRSSAIFATTVLVIVLLSVVVFEATRPKSPSSSPPPTTSPAGSTPATSTPPTSAPPTATATPAFTAYLGAGNAEGLKSAASALGQRVAYGSDSFDKRSWAEIDDDQWAIDHWRNSGYRMIWAVQMLPASGGVSLATGATGAYNGYFTTLAKNLVAAGMGNSILRLGWEFNQSKFPWYAAGQPENFVNYWRQVVTAMRAVPGAHFEFAWNPSRGDNGPKDRALGNLADYYPGNDYVDIIAMDVYDTAWKHYPGASVEFHTILTQTWGLDWLAGFADAHGKPMAIPEMGLGSGPSAPSSGPIAGSGEVSGGDDPTFIADMFQWIDQNNVAYIGFWDYADSSIQDGSNASAARALRQGLTSMSGHRISSDIMAN